MHRHVPVKQRHGHLDVFDTQSRVGLGVGATISAFVDAGHPHDASARAPRGYIPTYPTEVPQTPHGLVSHSGADYAESIGNNDLLHLRAVVL